ncbi:hypothetical protein, partial [Citrobacter braakii]
NDNTINNGGKNTADGEGSTGTDVTGDGNDINNTGDNSGTNGGTGTSVDGDGNTVDNGGNNTADGAGSTGTDVTGDGNDINNTGDNGATNGGTGTDVDGNDNTINNGGKNTADGAGSTGTDVTGDGNDINNTGDNSATGGGTGTKADGNGNTIDNKGNNTADGAGSTGTDVDGNGNKIINEGDTSAANGGTGTSVDGNDNTIDNKGQTTADGTGSTGTDVTGDGNKINNEGGTSAANGGTGTSVDGNDNTIDNKGQTTADGTGSTGTDVTGDGNKINNEGDTSATAGGTGTSVDGGGNTIDNKGTTTAEGEGSTGTDVAGNNNTINNDGASKVIDGATGAKVSGDGNTLNNAGEMTAGSTDSTKPSTGVDVAGNNNTINQNGKMVVGDFSTGLNVTGKSNTINLASEEMSITGNKATGVNVSGEANTVTLTGDMVVDKDQKSPQAMDYFVTPSTGINVSGSGNTVVLDGHLQVIVDTESFDHVSQKRDGTVEAIRGVVVSGDNNRVDLLGGVELTGEVNQIPGTERSAIGNSKGSVVTVNGKSSLYLHGDSSINGNYATTFESIFNVTNQGYLEISEDATVTTNIESMNTYWRAGDNSLVTLGSGGTATNKGTINLRDMNLTFMEGASSFTNDGSVTLDRKMALSSNDGEPTFGMMSTGKSHGVNNGDITGYVRAQNSVQTSTGSASYLFNSSSYAINLMDGIDGSESINNGTLALYGRGEAMHAHSSKASNYGTITADGLWKDANDTTVIGAGVSSTRAVDFAIGMGAGSLAGTGSGGSAVNYKDATITIYNAGAGMAVSGASNTIINQGTINLEKNEFYDETKPLVGMAVYKGGVAYNDGTININADNGQAFYNDGTGTIHNSGTINLNGGAMSSDDTHMGSVPADSNSAPASVQRVSGYVLGTSASGSVGTLNAGSNALALDSVSVDTGFTAGTAATTQTFDNVFTGADVEGVENITSESVVWSAQGQKDANGNVDVTMTKNAYTDVVTDSSVSGVAGALDAAYTNNELFSSLNLKTSADVTKAMKQISGNKAVNVSRDARRLSNRFDMLADAAPELGNGLSFNLVAKGDQRAELGKDTQYDMMALRQKLGFGDNQSLTMEYGIARLDGKGNVSSGSDGITGGYSQFLGLEHAMPLGEEGLSWNNALRYDVHQLDSKRGINYGDVNKQALADSRQQYLELRTEGRKTFAVSEGLDVVPYAGLKLRHTMEDGYQERGAGDFNLNMNSSTETAVDSVVGMKLSYAGKDGWAATATLEGGPNLSYVSTGKKASLQGAAGQSFNVDDGQKGGSINSMAQVGVKYNAGNTSAGLDAFHWKEDNISDKGFMLNIKHNF